MIGIILAAGLGSRLKPLINKNPKPLVKVNGKPILSFILDAFEMAGIKKIIIVVGYDKEKIISFCSDYPKPNFIFIENTKFDSTNNLYSLYIARNYLDDDSILIDGDTLVHPRILQDLMKLQTTSLVRDKIDFFKESLNICIKEGQTIKLSNKILNELKTDDDSTTIIKISKKDIKKIIPELENMIEKEGSLKKYVFTLFERLFRKGIIEIQIYNNNHKFWYEIDTLEDLKRIEKKIKSSTTDFLFL